MPFNDAFYEAGGTGIIEQWCASPETYTTCRGLCNMTSISGNGQIIWAFVSTAAICVTMCLSASEAWPILGGQALFVISQNFVVWIILTTAGPRALSRWQAGIMFCLAQSWIPIVTASLFSPVWSQNGNSAVKVHSLELAAEVKTAEGVLRRANTGLRPEARQALQMSQFELREQQELESHMYKGLVIKAAIAGVCWMFIMVVSTWFMIHYVWTDGAGYDFAEKACDEREDLQASFAGMKIFSYISLVVGFILIVAQTLSPILLKKGGAELYLDLVHPQLQKAAQALNGKAEKQEERKRKNSSQEAARMAFIRETEKVQRWATASMFLFWAIGTYTIWGIASRDFLLQANDPWTFGQVAPLVILVPHAWGLASAYRARNDTEIELAKLRKKRQEERGDSIASA